MMDLLKQLCALPGVSSFEDAVRDYIKEQAAPYVDTMNVDAMGNLICFKKGAKATGTKLMLCAHMDEVGLMVRSITEDGYLKFVCVGGMDRRVLLGKQVMVGDRQVPGVIGLKAIHMTTAEERKKVPKLEDYYIDIGASSREEAEALVEVGDPCVFRSDCVEFGDGCLKAKALDDRVGCAVLLELLRRDLPMDCTFVFTVQEEVGLRGAKTAAWSIDPDYGIAVDVTSEDGIPGAKHTASSLAGQGAAVKVMDRSVICHPEMVNLLMELAQKQGIPAQRDVIQAGGTDAGAIHQTRSGVCTGGISIPCRYTHTPCEMVCAADVEACVELVTALAQTKLEKEC